MNTTLNIQPASTPIDNARPNTGKPKQIKALVTNLEDEQSRQQALTANDIYRSVLRDYPDVLDVNQVGTILGVSTKTVYRLLNEGSLASLKIGRAFKIPKLYVMKYIKVLDSVEG